MHRTRFGRFGADGVRDVGRATVELLPFQRRNPPTQAGDHHQRHDQQHRDQQQHHRHQGNQRFHSTPSS